MQFYQTFESIRKLLADAARAAPHDQETAMQLVLAAKSEADSAVSQIDADLDAEAAWYESEAAERAADQWATSVEAA